MAGGPRGASVKVSLGSERVPGLGEPHGGPYSSLPGGVSRAGGGAYGGPGVGCPMGVPMEASLGDFQAWGPMGVRGGLWGPWESLWRPP